MTQVITQEDEKQDAFEAAAILAGIPMLLGLGIGSILLVGAWVAFVAWKFYGWFVVPLGLPTLSWWHFWGLLILLQMITYRPDNSPPQPIKTSFTRIAVRILSVGITLLVGWFIHGQVF